MNSILMIISDSPSLRATLREALTCSGHPYAKISECKLDDDANNALAQAAECSPNLVLVDIDYPSLRGLRLAKRIAQTFPQISLLILSTNPQEDADELLEVAKSGAKAYIRGNHTSFTELNFIVEQVSNGKYPICNNVARSPKVALRILTFFERTPEIAETSGPSTALSPQEKRTLALIADINQTRPIADALGLDEQTIMNHLRSILNKLAENAKIQDLLIEVQKRLLTYKIARDGNLFLFGALPSTHRPTELPLDSPYPK